jgi:L-cystine uptake protein TcyP (sodium:dicarboxylate symporter family)
LGDAFIALIKMMIAPVIFCTVVHGIASMSDLKKIGRIGVKTLFYFEAVSTLALVIGLLIGKILQPGTGFNIDPAALDAKAVATYVSRAGQEGVTTHLMNIIPNTFVSAFSGGDISSAAVLVRHRLAWPPALRPEVPRAWVAEARRPGEVAVVALRRASAAVGAQAVLQRAVEEQVS